MIDLHPKTVVIVKRITPSDPLQKDLCCIFGDNDERTGRGGLAEICRGYRQSIGIPTKKKPSLNDNAFYRDEDLEIFEIHLEYAIRLMNFWTVREKTLVYPEGGIGRSLAHLDKKSPLVFRSLLRFEKELMKFRADDSFLFTRL